MSGASNIVWMLLSRPAVPGQQTTNPQPLHSLSVKLFKSLTIANDVFMFTTYYRRFPKACFRPHLWVFGGAGGFGHYAGPLTASGAVTGCPRGPRKTGRIGAVQQSCSFFVVVFYIISFVSPVLDAGSGQNKQQKHPNTILKTMFFWA